MTCDGSTRAGQDHTLDHTYVACLDHNASHIFFAATAIANYLIFGGDVTNAFGEAPGPAQIFYIWPDDQFRDWWK